MSFRVPLVKSENEPRASPRAPRRASPDTRGPGSWRLGLGDAQGETLGDVAWSFKKAGKNSCLSFVCGPPKLEKGPLGKIAWSFEGAFRQKQMAMELSR